MRTGLKVNMVRVVNTIRRRMLLMTVRPILLRQHTVVVVVDYGGGTQICGGTAPEPEIVHW